MNKQVEYDCDVEQVLEDQRAIADSIAIECLREIFHHIPKGHEFTLSNGKKAQIKTFFEPRGYVNDDDRRPAFGLDVRIDDFSIDHIEFCMKKTGQGGFLAP